MPHLVEKNQRLFTEGKIFLKYCNMSKLKGGSIDPPPPPYVRHVQRVITHKILLKIFPKLIEKTILRYKNNGIMIHFLTV